MATWSPSPGGTSGGSFSQTELLQRIEQKQAQILRWVQIVAVLVVVGIVVIFI
jgi:hypothetical protein